MNMDRCIMKSSVSQFKYFCPVTWKNTKDLPEGALESADSDPEEAPEDPRTEEDDVNELLHVDRLSLEVGYRLIPLVYDHVLCWH